MEKQVILALSATLLCGSAFAKDINKVDWPMHQFDASHTGYVPVKLNHKKFKFDWKTNIGDAASTSLNYSISPAVTASNLVFVSRSNYKKTLQAFSINDGHEVWKVNYDEPSVNPPSTDGKRVYVQTVNNCLGGTDFYGYNINNGEIIFRTPFHAQWESYLAPTIFKSNVYADGGTYGGMYSFDSTTGKINWNTPLAMYDKWTPAVNDKVAVAYTGGKLNVIDQKSGQWLFDIVDPNYSWHGYSAGSAPVLVNDQMAIMIQSGYLSVFDLDEKEVTYSFGPGYSDQASTDGELIYASKNNGLTVIGTNDMEESWAWFKQNENVTGQFVVTDNLIFLATDKNIYAIDKKTHKETWKYTGTGTLSLAKGHLFISSPKGYLEAIKVS